MRNRLYVAVFVAMLVCTGTWFMMNNGSVSTAEKENPSRDNMRLASHDGTERHSHDRSRAKRNAEALRFVQQAGRSALKRDRGVIAHSVDPEVGRHPATKMLEEMFREQVVDREWTSAVGGELSEMMEDPGFVGSAIEGVSCRENLCRVVMSHDGDDAYDYFADKGAEQGPWKGMARGFKSTGDNDELLTAVYFSKQDDKTPFAELHNRVLEQQSPSGIPPSHGWHQVGRYHLAPIAPSWRKSKEWSIRGFSTWYR